MNHPKSNTKIYLITGNTRVGGAQRILMDEFYELTQRGIAPKIISFSKRLENDDILNVDRNFPLAQEVEIFFAGEGKIKQLVYLMREFAFNSGKFHVLSHDFTGVLISRIASIATLKHVKIDLYVHQLMNLSDSRQRQKRVILSLFASDIYVSSFQFKKSWENYLGHSKFWRKVYRKKIVFDRMGIYIPRVLNPRFNKIEVCASQVSHVIFMSRITAWKGFSVFSDYSKKYVNNSLHSLILTTKNGRPEIFNEEIFIDDLRHAIYESGVGNLRFPRGSVHLYPTNYGAEISYPQSIGMNVLELLAVGVPSIISPEEFLSWPELENSSLISVNDWLNDEVLHSLVCDLGSLSETEIEREVNRLIPAISISTHIDRVMSNLIA